MIRSLANRVHIPLWVAAATLVCDANCRAADEPAFTVRDEIGLILFGPPDAQAVRFAPDGRHFAVWSERGRLDDNTVEDTLRVYTTKDITRVLRGGTLDRQPLSPRTLSRTGNVGPVIADWRWLSDSKGIAFLEGAPHGCKRLYLYRLASASVVALADENECVGVYDVRDAQHYAYSSEIQSSTTGGVGRPDGTSFTVGTGRSLFDLLFPGHDSRYHPPDTRLHAVVDGRRVEVVRDGVPFVRKSEGASGNQDLVLSPDGRALVTALQIPVVTAEWQALYPPPFRTAPYRIQAGKPANQFVGIDLERGTVRPLVNAPTADSGGWWLKGDATLQAPSWSRDGAAILLPSTYVPSDNAAPSRPCVAVIEIASGHVSCVQRFEEPDDPVRERAFHHILGAGFVDGDASKIAIRFGHADGSQVTVQYRRLNNMTWKASRSRNKIASEQSVAASSGGLRVSVRQSANDPPTLMAELSGRARVIWDPNPQLGGVTLGRVITYTWKDEYGRDWTGGLYLPSESRSGKRLPLVIQTHGFDAHEFAPSGWRPSSFAARALQAAGMVVLQVRENCALSRPDEALCAMTGYEAGARQLIADGIADPDRIGIVGFSRTCFYAMEMLTKGSLSIAAASITDGLMLTYTQYILTEGLLDNGVASGSDAVIGAQPFGSGLQQWLARSPGFNLHKIKTPLLVVGEGAESVMQMWEPYAGLRYLGKPVDLIMLNTQEHILTNPQVKLASQGGTVDWFRFWLKGEEDRSPEKAEQYRRWLALRAQKDSGLQLRQADSRRAFGSTP